MLAVVGRRLLMSRPYGHQVLHSSSPTHSIISVRSILWITEPAGSQPESRSTAAPNTGLETKQTVEDPSASGVVVAAAQREKMVPSPHQNSSGVSISQIQPRSGLCAARVCVLGPVSHPASEDRNVPSSATTIPDKTVAKGDPGTRRDGDRGFQSATFWPAGPTPSGE